MVATRTKFLLASILFIALALGPSAARLLNLLALLPLLLATPRSIEPGDR